MIAILSNKLQFSPHNRAALSLLGYCYFYVQDYAQAADVYDQLTKFCPEVDQYKMYFAQSLLKAGLYNEAANAVQKIDSLEC